MSFALKWWRQDGTLNKKISFMQQLHDEAEAHVSNEPKRGNFLENIFLNQAAQNQQPFVAGAC